MVGMLLALYFKALMSLILLYQTLIPKKKVPRSMQYGLAVKKLKSNLEWA